MYHAQLILGKMVCQFECIAVVHVIERDICAKCRIQKQNLLDSLSCVGFCYTFRVRGNNGGDDLEAMSADTSMLGSENRLFGSVWLATFVQYYRVFHHYLQGSTSYFHLVCSFTTSASQHFNLIRQNG